MNFLFTIWDLTLVFPIMFNLNFYALPTFFYSNLFMMFMIFMIFIYLQRLFFLLYQRCRFMIHLNFIQKKIIFILVTFSDVQLYLFSQITLAIYCINGCLFFNTHVYFTAFITCTAIYLGFKTYSIELLSLSVIDNVFLFILECI